MPPHSGTAGWEAIAPYDFRLPLETVFVPLLA